MVKVCLAKHRPVEYAPLMHARVNSPTQLVVFWPLVLLALLLRLTFGGMVVPSSVLVDQAVDLTKLSILCNDSSAPFHQDGHHHDADSHDDSLLLSDALELFLLAVGGCLVVGRFLLCLVQRLWIFTPIRGPPLLERIALCPQGPPV